jgi:hypothetical protein
MDNIVNVEASLIKIVGIFSFNKNDIKKITDAGYTTIPIVESESENEKLKSEIKSTLSYYKDTYYKEFAEIMLIGQGKKIKHTVKPFQKKDRQDIRIAVGKKDEEKYIEATIDCKELFLFDNSIGIFSITISPKELSIENISAITAFARHFSCVVEFNKKNTELHQWISEHVLAGIPLIGSKSDAFSGSKFKIYSILSVNENKVDEHYKRDYLIYEIGTGSKMGTRKNAGYFAPSELYTESLMQNRISIFNNWEGLCLLDSFTVVGGSVYDKPTIDFYKHHNWNRVYFSMYVYNLFMRYSLFMFNHQFLDDEIAARDQYQAFLNRYNFKIISFNFLPNILFDGIRKGLNLDDEIELFENRIGNLASSIQDKQEKRQAFLLGLISLLSSISAIEPILEMIRNLYIWTGWSPFIFYFTFTVILILLLTTTLAFLFPNLYKRLKNKWL